MKKKLFFGTLAILGVIVWSWIMGASAHINCSQAGITQTHGLCLARSLAEGSCFVGYLSLWTYLGGVVAKSKRRHPAIGWVLGFFLQFLGCLILMISEKKKSPEEKVTEAKKKEQEQYLKNLKITWKGK